MHNSNHTMILLEHAVDWWDLGLEMVVSSIPPSPSWPSEVCPQPTTLSLSSSISHCYTRPREGTEGEGGRENERERGRRHVLLTVYIYIQYYTGMYWNLIRFIMTGIVQTFDMLRKQMNLTTKCHNMHSFTSTCGTQQPCTHSDSLPTQTSCRLPVLSSLTKYGWCMLIMAQGDLM